VVGMGVTWDIRGAANRRGPCEVGMGDMRDMSREEDRERHLSALEVLAIERGAA
jgi:hypothetical protein